MKYSPKIDSRLSPTYKDSIDVGILDYLSSRSFERWTVSNKLDGTNSSNLVNNPNSENYAIFLNQINKDNYRVSSNQLIALLMIDFIKWLKNRTNLNAILEDIKSLGVNNTHLPQLNKAIEEHKLKFKFKKLEIPNSNTIDFEIIKPINTILKPMSTKNNDTFSANSSKNNWIILVSEAKYDRVIQEIRDIALSENKQDLLDTIVNISSRWHILKEQINKNLLEQDKINIETNKINKALLDFIQNIKY